MRVLRVYHAARNPAHRKRDRALVAAGVDLTLIAPTMWPDPGTEDELVGESFPILELPVSRAGDVNRHRYVDAEALQSLIREVGADVLDVHEEPVSLVGRQALRAAPKELPIVMYAAQNVDKRFPPPFAQYEQDAYRRVSGLYPCSRQAASVARGKGFRGDIDVIPLGLDATVFYPGRQSLDDAEVGLALSGRLVPEKGVRDAVHVLARVNRHRPTRLVIVGAGEEAEPAMELADRLGVGDRLLVEPWLDAAALAELYRRTHVVLVPSLPTATWTEQFGRVIVEAHASGAVVAGYATGAIEEVAGGAAVLVEGGDVDGLERRVSALLTDPAAFEALREQGMALSRGRTWQCVASLQADLYARVAEGKRNTVPFERSPRARRAHAAREFGPPAPTIAGMRPFALPVLREGGSAAEVLAKAIDVGSELKARVTTVMIR